MNKILRPFVGLFLFLTFGFIISTPVFAETTSMLLPVFDGTYSQWNPKSGSVHFAMVDEAVCNGVTDFVWTNTVNARDSYGVDISSIPDGATIENIEIVPCASKNGNGGKDSQIKLFYRLNGHNSADSTAFSVNGTTPVQLPSWTFQTNNSIKTSTSSLEIGAVHTSGNKGVRLGRIAGRLTYIPLRAPTSLSATASSSTMVNLSWIDSSTNETGFIIERSLDGITGWIEIASKEGNVTSYVDSGLTSNTTYYYRVASFNAGASYYSNTAQVATPPALPASPTNLEGTLETSTSAILEWHDNSDNEEGFRVERREGNLGNWFEIGNMDENTTYFTDYFLAQGQEYHYRIRAYNTDGESNYSNTFVINGDIPNAPSHISVTKDICGGVVTPLSVRWQDNSLNEDGFQLEISDDSNGVYTPLASVSANTTLFDSVGTGCFVRIRSFNGLGVSQWANTEVIVGY